MHQISNQDLTLTMSSHGKTELKLIQTITLIHLNSFKFKHKNERNQGKEFTLNFGLKWVRVWPRVCTVLGHQKSVLVLIFAPHLCTSFLSPPCSKNSFGTPKLDRNLLPPSCSNQSRIQPQNLGINFLLQISIIP